MGLQGRALTRALMAPMVTVLLVFGLTGMAMPVMPLHVHGTLGLGTFVVGLVAGAQFAASFLSRLHAGDLSDRRGTRLAVRGGLMAASVSGLLYLASLPLAAWPEVSAAVLLLARALLGGAESFVVTGALAWGLSLAEPPEAGRVMSWIGIAMYAAIALGAPLGSALYTGFGFAAIGWVGVLLPLLVLPLARAAPALGTPSPGGQRSWAPVLSTVAWPGAALALASIGFAAITGFISLLFAERGWQPVWAGFTAFAGGFVGARVLGGRLPDRLGGARVALVSVLIEATGLVMLTTAGSADAATAGALVAGLGYALVYPGWGVEVVRRVPASQRALAMGAFTACLDLALGVAGPALGLLAARSGLAAAFGAGAVMVLLSAAVGLVSVRRTARR